MSGRLFIFSGPSGSGKSTICAGLLDIFADLEISLSTTTRLPREGETDGVEYLFVDDAEFDRMVKEGLFVEWATVHRHRYGTSLAVVEAALGEGNKLLLDVDVQGAVAIRKLYPDAVATFLLPPSREVLAARLAARGTDSDEVIGHRLAEVASELARVADYNHCVVNDDLEVAKAACADIVRGSSNRVTSPVEGPARAVLDSFEEKD